MDGLLALLTLLGRLLGVLIVLAIVLLLLAYAWARWRQWRTGRCYWCTGSGVVHVADAEDKPVVVDCGSCKGTGLAPHVRLRAWRAYVAEHDELRDLDEPYDQAREHERLED